MASIGGVGLRVGSGAACAPTRVRSAGVSLPGLVAPGAARPARPIIGACSSATTTRVLRGESLVIVIASVADSGWGRVRLRCAGRSCRSCRSCRSFVRTRGSRPVRRIRPSQRHISDRLGDDVETDRAQHAADGAIVSEYPFGKRGAAGRYPVRTGAALPRRIGSRSTRPAWRAGRRPALAPGGAGCGEVGGGRFGPGSQG